MDSLETMGCEAGSCIQTFTGKKFDVLNPDPSMVDIEDIAHALSCIPRFCGHLRRPWSVADHCFWASKIVKPGYELEALLHDAAEAYCGDMPRPIKVAIDWQPVEDRILRAVGLALNVSLVPLPLPVKVADNMMLATEKQMLMGPATFSWGALGPVSPDPALRKMMCMHTNWGHAKMRFLHRYDALVKARQKGTT